MRRKRDEAKTRRDGQDETSRLGWLASLGLPGFACGLLWRNAAFRNCQEILHTNDRTQWIRLAGSFVTSGHWHHNGLWNSECDSHCDSHCKYSNGKVTGELFSRVTLAQWAGRLMAFGLMLIFTSGSSVEFGSARNFRNIKLSEYKTCLVRTSAKRLWNLKNNLASVKLIFHCSNLSERWLSFIIMSLNRQSGVGRPLAMASKGRACPHGTLQCIRWRLFRQTCTMRITQTHQDDQFLITFGSIFAVPSIYRPVNKLPLTNTSINKGELFRFLQRSKHRSRISIGSSAKYCSFHKLTQAIKSRILDFQWKSLSKNSPTVRLS